MDTPKVLLVEDDAPTRDRLAGIIRNNDKLALLAAAGSCEEARSYLAEAVRPQVVMVDLGLPDGSGIDLISEFRSLTPPPEVMVITVFGDEQHVLAAIGAGASSYLLKDADAESTEAAILELLAGGAPISPSIARHLLKHVRNTTKGEGVVAETDPGLTHRELEVLRLVARGFSNAEIADLIGVSYHTVASHIRHVYRKLSVNSRSAAVFEALQLGLVNLGE